MEVNNTKNIKSMNFIVGIGCVFVVKKGDKDFKIEGIELGDYISPKLKKELKKRYEEVCIDPVVLLICTCKSNGKYQKVFFVSYPKPNDFSNKTVTITSEQRIYKTDIKKIKEAFINARIKVD